MKTMTSTTILVLITLLVAILLGVFISRKGNAPTEVLLREEPVVGEATKKIVKSTAQNEGELILDLVKAIKKSFE